MIDAITLTNRQLEILRIKATGKTDGQAAVILGISQHTVSAHLQAIRNILRAQNTSEALLIARRYKLIN